MDLPAAVLESYAFTDPVVRPFGSGLINHTFLVTDGSASYILQRVNTGVFKDPFAIAGNTEALSRWLSAHEPGYFFVQPVYSRKGKAVVQAGSGYYRLFPFVQGSHALQVTGNAEQAFEAARQFGKFTALLAGFDAASLTITLPHFHDLALRYREFEETLEQGDRQRINDAVELIDFVMGHAGIVTRFEMIKQNPDFRLRVTHHDTKISNVLFDAEGKGICVIDLDTVMPGYFISDVGDMMRTYLSPVSEEEQDLGRIIVRDDVYAAIIKGYGDEMDAILTETEKQHFFYAGEFMIYMQALRFLTDHLNLDRYYGARYPGHNFNRAMNQAVLLERFREKEKLFETIKPAGL